MIKTATQPTHLNSLCCSKALAEPESRLTPDSPTTIVKDVSFHGWLVLDAAPLDLFTAPALTRTADLSHSAAPPPDRVIVFQHFLI